MDPGMTTLSQVTGPIELDTPRAPVFQIIPKDYIGLLGWWGGGGCSAHADTPRSDSHVVAFRYHAQTFRVLLYLTIREQCLVIREQCLVTSFIPSFTTTGLPTPMAVDCGVVFVRQSEDERFHMDEMEGECVQRSVDNGTASVFDVSEPSGSSARVLPPCPQRPFPETFVR